MAMTMKVDSDDLTRYAERLEETAAMLLTIANRLRKAAREQWHSDYPTGDEEPTTIQAAPQ